MTIQQLPLREHLCELASEYHKRASILTNELLGSESKNTSEQTAELLHCESRFEIIMEQLNTLRRSDCESMPTFEAHDFLRYLQSTLENLQMYNGFYKEASDILCTLEDSGLGNTLFCRRLTDKLTKLEQRGAHLPYSKKNSLSKTLQELDRLEYLAKDLINPPSHHFGDRSSYNHDISNSILLESYKNNGGNESTSQLVSKRCSLFDIISFVTHCKSGSERLKFLNVGDECLSRATKGYSELISTRNKLAESLGYSNYVELVDVATFNGNNCEELIRSYLRDHEVKSELVRHDVSAHSNVAPSILDMKHNQHFHVENYSRIKLMEVGVSHINYSDTSLGDLVRSILSELPDTTFEAHSKNHVTISRGTKSLEIQLCTSVHSDTIINAVNLHPLESVTIVSQPYESVIQQYKETRRLFGVIYELILEIMPKSTTSEICPLSIQLAWEDVNIQKELIKERESDALQFVNALKKIETFLFFNDCKLALNEIRQYQDHNINSPKALFETYYDATLVLGQTKLPNFARVAKECIFK